MATILTGVNGQPDSVDTDVSMWIYVDNSRKSGCMKSPSIDRLLTIIVVVLIVLLAGRTIYRSAVLRDHSALSP